MLPTKSHAHAPTLAYYAPASPPTTAELVTLQSDIDNLGIKISRSPLANCDTRNLREAAEERDDLIDLVMSLSQRLGAEIASRRRETAPTYKITAVGLMLLDQGPVRTPEERVNLAEKEALEECRHPVAVGGCDLAMDWTFGGEGRPA